MDPNMLMGMQYGMGYPMMGKLTSLTLDFSQMSNQMGGQQPYGDGTNFNLNPNMQFDPNAFQQGMGNNPNYNMFYPNMYPPQQ
jgi:hypothetical protein